MASLTKNKPALFSAGSKVELNLKNISKKFPGVQALSNVDFFLRSNQVHALVGENGAGKSTLMKIIAGIEKPDEGEIFLNGKKIKFNSPREAQNNGISIVHQEADLFPSLTVASRRVIWIIFARKAKLLSCGNHKSGYAKCLLKQA